MEVKINNNGEMLDATIEMVDGVMVVSPKEMKFEPKDGDVVFSGSSLISIFKEMSSVMTLASYVSLSNDELIKEYDFWTASNVRPATEEEKKKLFDTIAEEGYEFDFEKKELVKLKWKPKVGDTYFRPDFNRCMFMCYEGKYRYDTMRYIKDCVEKGWTFRTKEECQEFCNRLNDAINSVKP